MRQTLLAALMAAGLLGSARAEVAEISVAQQYGIAMAPLMVMQQQHLAEKHAAALGVPTLKVNWVVVAGSSVMNDGLISGALQFAAVGAPSLITLWERTQRNAGIRGVGAITNNPQYLVSRNPAVKTVQDFGTADKIAVPAVKISTQALMLEMAAAGLFGQANYTKFDTLTIALSHPDAMAALAGGTAGVNAHFTVSPYYEREIKLPGAHLVTTNYEMLGGPATSLALVASSRFRDANPKVFQAFYEGLAEAIDIVNRDKPGAAALYVQVTGDTFSTVPDLIGIISDKDYAFTLRPAKMMAVAQFMAKIGTIKQAPATLADMFFPEAAALGGD